VKPAPSPETRPPKSVGRTALNKVLSGLGPSHRWITRESGGFVWWLSGHATRVRVEPPAIRAGQEVTRLHASTAFLRGVGVDDRIDTAIARLNRFAVLAAIVRDAADPSLLVLRSSLFVYPGRERVGGLLLRQIVGLQALQALWTSHVAASHVGGEPDTRPHPKSGHRPAPEACLGSLEAVLASWGARPSVYDGEELSRLASFCERPPCLSSSFGDGQLTAEFPFLGESSVLEMTTEEPHAAFGNGLRARLTLPVGATPAERAAVAGRLNRTELEGCNWTNFAGAWSDGGDGVTYTTFLPNFVNRQELLLDVGFGLAYRARWVAEHVFLDDWDRVPARSSLERLAAQELPS